MSCESTIRSSFIAGDTASQLIIQANEYDELTKRFVRKDLTGKTVILRYRYQGSDPWTDRTMTVLSPGTLGAQYQWVTGELVKGRLEVGAKIVDAQGKILSTTRTFIDVDSW